MGFVQLETYEKPILLGVLVLFSLMAFPYLFQESLWNDETVYMWMANKIKENPSFLLSEHPAKMSYGYLFSTIAAFLSNFMEVFYAARITSFLFSIAGIVAIYYAAKKSINQYAGITAAFLLGSNALFFFITNRALLDAPLTAIFSIIYLALVYFNPDDWKSGLLLGILSLVAILTKTSGFLAVPSILFALFVMYPHPKNWTRKGIMTCLFVILASGFLYLGNNYLQFGNFMLGDISKLQTTVIFGGSHAFYLQNANHIFTLPLFLLGIAGIIIAIQQKDKLMGVAVVGGFQFLFFSFLVGEKVDRYILPTLPAIILFSLYFLDWSLNKLKISPKWVIIILLLSCLNYPTAKNLTESRMYTYTGFQEIGITVKNLEKNHNFEKIYSQSSRQIRAFSGIEYESDGGKIKLLPKTLEELEDQENILIQLDIWEYTGPEWAYPLTQEKVDNLIANNFTMVHVVYRDYPTQDGLQKIPVGLLMVK